MDKWISAPPLLFLVDRFAGDLPGAPTERAPAWIPAGRVEFSESSGISAEIATIHERTLPVEKRAGVIGRGPSYPLALEAALKVKEVSYAHAEGFGGAS